MGLIKKSRKISFFLFLLGGAFLAFPRLLDSADLISVKDTLSTSRLSYHAKNATTFTAGSTLIRIASSGTPSTTTTNIFPGDTIRYKSTDNTYTVEAIIDGDEFTIGVGLSANDADADDEFVINRQSIHTIGFTAPSAIANGAIRVRIPADSVNNNDGEADDDGWDFNSIGNSQITCPADIPGFYDFVAGTATVSGGTGCAAGYHCFECRYSGPGKVNQSITGFGIGNTAAALINPSPAYNDGDGDTHTVGTADNYAIIIENLDSSNNVVDSRTIRVAVIESVRVTATVDATITFTIAGVTSGTACGSTLGVGTSAALVPFGSLSLDTLTTAAQTLTVSTNAAGGFVVTAVEDNELSIGGDDVVIIADTPGDDNEASHITKDGWGSTSTYGFGYSLFDHDNDTTEAFSYTDTDSTCAGDTWCAKQFANAADGEVGQTLFSSTGVASSQDVYICYRINVSPTQQAGNYENSVTYVATATY